ncbi:MAG: right-handed parallel beta-helix repeat-containing protein, partial [Candidatus Thorarchaeota archaeon]
METQSADKLIQGAQSQNTSQFEFHEPIKILNNTDFQTQAITENWSGDGSRANPYVIEELIIGDFDGNLIEVRNTDVHFIIRNCILNNSSGIYFHQVMNGFLLNNIIFEGNIYLSDSEHNFLFNNTIVCSYWRGIYLYNSGFCTLIENMVDNSYAEGIYLYKSVNCSLANNMIENCIGKGIQLYHSEGSNLTNNMVINNPDTGILLEFSDYSILKNNCVSNNSEEGISLRFSDNCIVTDNFLKNNREEGFLIERSEDNVIMNNILINNSFTITGGGLEHYIQTIENNLINNKPLIYWKHVIGGTVPSGAGAIIFINSSSITVEEQNVVEILAYSCSHLSIQANIILNSSNGITLKFSNNSIISDNFVVNSKNVGIYISGSQDISLINNTVTQSNMEGIGLYGSWNTTLINNTVTYNNREGIYVYSSENCTLTNNIVSNNNKRGIDLNTSGNSTIINNLITNNDEEGINLYRSGDCTVRYNSLVNNSFSITGWLLEHYLQTEIKDNIINSKPLVYWQHETDRTIPYGAGMVILVNCSFVNVINQDMVGVLGAFCQDLLIQSCIISYGYYGIWFEDSFNIQILNTNITNNRMGIFLYSSRNNILINNTVCDNKIEGIKLYGSGNSTLTHNIVNNNNGNGIFLGSSGSSILTNNQISNNSGEGMIISYSENNEIKNNNLKDNSFSITGSTLNHYV